MKVKIRPHPEIWKEFGIKGVPYWYRIPGVEPQGHSGYRKVMIMLEPNKELLSPNEQLAYEPVTEVIDEKDRVPQGILTSRKLIVEEYDEETPPKKEKQSKKEVE